LLNAMWQINPIAQNISKITKIAQNIRLSNLSRKVTQSHAKVGRIRGDGLAEAYATYGTHGTYATYCR
jgi:hypothetical protein